jgi:hypothetical protein
VQPAAQHPSDDVRLALAETLFGPDPGERSPACAALGKVWERVGTGRGTTLEVRIGWVAGVQYLQFVEAGAEAGEKTASILVRASAVGQIAEALSHLARYEG